MTKEAVLQGAGTQSLGTYVDRRQTTVAEWVALRPVFDVCTRETGYKEGGETPGAMVEAGGSGESAEGHSRSYFGRGKGAVATGIGQVWQERGRVGGGEHVQRRIRARQGTSVYWDGDR